MTPARLGAIGLIFVATATAWFLLGSSILVRTGSRGGQLEAQVEQLWGGSHRQLAPAAAVERARTETETVTEKDATGAPVTGAVSRVPVDVVPLVLDSTHIQAQMHVDHRRKGLLWYDTYEIGFHGRYTVTNPDDEARPLVVTFSFPSRSAIYDGFVFRVDGHDAAPVTDLSHGATVRTTVAARAPAEIEITYRSRGIGAWSYALVESGVGQARDFDLVLDTDFAAIDFPAGSLSPTAEEQAGAGWKLTWRFTSVVTGQVIGVVPPSKLNPGPLAARITYFAPVSLLFFLTVMVILGMIRGQNLHPMNYFFLSTSFFAFHLLLAYLADQIDIHAAFAISAAISIALVTSYLRLVAGMRRFVLHAAAAQLLYLVLFSYAFFFQGLTGLAITIGSVMTLAVLMQLTAHIDWERIFTDGRAGASRAPRAPFAAGSPSP
ncbi:MAG: inner membrane CreD family protein [Deltaproteobacteria bacterium]|nr:inner membrane CreD family protein [Deltaproteobacteria bacterium]